MSLRALLAVFGVLAAGVAAGAFSAVQGPVRVDPVLLAPDGVGPLRLGHDYEAAAAAARRAAPESAFAGIGCGGLDEVRYSTRLGELPVSVMGMAEAGALVEVELMLDAPTRAADESACLALRDELAAPFFARFGAVGPEWTVEKPVSTEHLQRVGPAVLVARWFPTGQSCYVSALYGSGET
jgi:hypothetical protein